MGTILIQQQSGSQVKQQQQCLMVLCYLKQHQYQSLGFQQEQFRKKLNIFPSIIINPFRIFVNDLEVFQTSQEFSQYVQCVNLEGDLKRIVIFIDVTFQQSLIDNYCKIIQSEIHNQITQIVIFSDRSNSYQKDNYQLKKYFQNITNFVDKQKCFQNILQNSKSQQSICNYQLNHKSTYVDEQIIQNITRVIEKELENLNNLQFEKIREFQQNYQYFTNKKNQIIQDQCQKNTCILQCKFNYKIMEQISRYTNQVLDKIFKLINKFKNSFLNCSNCKSYWFLDANDKLYLCEFFSGFFKQKDCEKCKLYSVQFDNLKNLYDSQRMCFQIDHCLQYLNQNQFVQFDKSLSNVIDISQDKYSSNVVDSDNHHILLIGKAGVGKTTLFNLLCDGKAKRFNDPTQEPIVKTCLNSNITIMDTPPFELEKNDSLENIEKMKQIFSNILTYQKVSQIFIVVKYDRLSVMKQNLIGCLKFLGSFRNKISLIIVNDSENRIKEQQNDLEKIFETNRILIFNFRFANEKLNEVIEKHLYNLNAKLEYLIIENTDFDIKKSKKEQKAMIKQLEKIKMQRKKVEIESLFKENQSISMKIESNQTKIEQLNKEQSELNKKLILNSQSIQEYFNNIIKEQSNTNLFIQFDE